jgi:MscS family membrane protein
LDGRIVTMPNSKVTDNAVLNVSKERGRKIKFYLGLTYDTTPENIELAKQIIVDILDKNENTIDAVVAFDSFGDFSLNILVIYWIKSGSPIVQVNDHVNMEILKQFNANKLDFAFPTQTVIVQK